METISFFKVLRSWERESDAYSNVRKDFKYETGSAGFTELTVVSSMRNDEAAKHVIRGDFEMTLPRETEVDGQPIEGRALHREGTL